MLSINVDLDRANSLPRSFVQLGQYGLNKTKTKVELCKVFRRIWSASDVVAKDLERNLSTTSIPSQTTRVKDHMHPSTNCTLSHFSAN
jgi:hypothetical protein